MMITNRNENIAIIVQIYFTFYGLNKIIEQTSFFYHFDIQKNYIKHLLYCYRILDPESSFLWILKYPTRTCTDPSFLTGIILFLQHPFMFYCILAFSTFTTICRFFSKLFLTICNDSLRLFSIISVPILAEKYFLH